jgi:predicted MPP superfamily phosphohydrolase
MATMTWLHLSDLHFRTGEGHTWDEDIVLRALLDDVREHVRKGLVPDLILVSGDVAFSGAPAEYALARAFFDDLLAATRLPREQLFAVPGNHDVDRKRIGIVAKKMGPTLTTRDAVNDVLADADARQAFMRRFEGYSAFLADHLGHMPFDDEDYFYVSHLDLAGCRLAVLGLNSAWRAQGGDGDRGHLALGERQVRKALDAARGADLRLAVLHHPFDWLGDFDREDCEALLTRECDFVLHGHLHRTGLTLQQTPDAKAMIVAAGAGYETRRSHNSYNLVQLDPETGQGAVHLRAWSDRAGGFWAKDVLSYRNVPDGVYRFSLVDSAARVESPPPGPKPAPDPAVRPFIEATEALQSRLYNVLKRGGLGALRRESPSGEYAADMVYLVARYFGWERLLRKGAYGSDEEVITTTERIRDAFATGQFRSGVFAVFRAKQEAIGQLVVRRVPGAAGAEYEALSLYAFQERLASPPLSAERWIQETLAALKETRSIVHLEGRERLVAVQDALVDLLEYLEGREGYSVFPGKRKKASSTAPPGAAAGGAAGEPPASAPAHPGDTGSSQTATAEGGNTAAAGRGVAQAGDGNVAISGDVQGSVTIIQDGGRATEAAPAAAAGAEPGGYDLAAVRDLLLAAFTAPTLRRLFLYTGNTELGALSQEFSPTDGLTAMVDRTVEFCLTRGLLPDLLEEVKGANARQYGRFAHQLRAKE